MREPSDTELLRRYALNGDETAFRTLVERHADLVYSAAWRQLASPDLARDVAQSVFTALARKAKELLPAQPAERSLVGWLYRSTRFATLAQLRQDSRRQARERQAMALSSSEPATDWEQVGPVLDAAMSDLGDQDREALLLRFFKGCDFHTVGEALGISDDAAQKRVSRALEKLRAAFARRGVTTTALALSTLISAQAVSAAPAGLATTLATAALAGATLPAVAATTTTTTQILAMTTLQKAALTATLTVFAGAGFYQAHETAHWRDQSQRLEQERAAFTEQLTLLQHERDEARLAAAAATAPKTQTAPAAASAEVLKLRGEVAALRQQLALSSGRAESANDPFTRSVLGLVTRAAELNQHLEQRPQQRIPELQLLTENDWLNAARTAKFDTDADIRRALRELRSAAKVRLPLGGALNSFLNAHGGELPTDLAQLKPYFKMTDDADSHWKNVDPAQRESLLDDIFARYKIVHSGNMSNLPPDTWIVVEKAPVDKEYDCRARFGNGRSGCAATGLGQAGDPNDPY